MKRTMPTALIAALSLVGCMDMGLDENRPLEEARQAPVSELVAAVTTPRAEDGRQALVVEGTLWVPSGLPWAGDPEQLQPIGSAAGHTVHARRWDTPPYDQLFTRMEGTSDDPLALDPEAPRWQGYLPVVGGGAPSAGASASH